MRLLVLRHGKDNGLGRIASALELRGLEAEVRSFADESHAPFDLSDYGGLIVLGGAMSANEDAEWLRRELALIDDALRSRVPLMGICLGSQLISKALGKRVLRARQAEIGWGNVSPTADAADDALFGGFHESTPVFQWHYDTYELPDGAVRLAHGEECEEQAYRWGDRVYAMQFHLEVSPREISMWQEQDRECEPARELKADVNPHLYERELSALAEQVFGGFLELVRRG